MGVRRVLTDRLLGTQVLACSAYFALFNQLYLALPIEAKRVTGRPESIAGVFLVSCVLGILMQVRVTALCRRWWTAAQATVAGLALMAMSFVPLLGTTGLIPDQPRALPLSQVMVHAWPLLLTTVLFSLGVAIVTPFIVVLLADAVGDALLGTAYGWYFLVSALAATAVATASGALLDLGGDPAVPCHLPCWLPSASPEPSDSAPWTVVANAGVTTLPSLRPCGPATHTDRLSCTNQSRPADPAIEPATVRCGATDVGPARTPRHLGADSLDDVSGPRPVRHRRRHLCRFGRLSRRGRSTHAHECRRRSGVGLRTHQTEVLPQPGATGLLQRYRDIPLMRLTI